MDIRRLGPGDDRALEKVGPQFDKARQAAAGTRFLKSEGHHILVAYEGEAVASFVTGVEMTHPGSVRLNPSGGYGLTRLQPV